MGLALGGPKKLLGMSPAASMLGIGSKPKDPTNMGGIGPQPAAKNNFMAGAPLGLAYDPLKRKSFL